MGTFSVSGLLVFLARTEHILFNITMSLYMNSRSSTFYPYMILCIKKTDLILIYVQGGTKRENMLVTVNLPSACDFYVAFSCVSPLKKNTQSDQKWHLENAMQTVRHTKKKLLLHYYTANEQTREYCSWENTPYRF